MSCCGLAVRLPTAGVEMTPTAVPGAAPTWKTKRTPPLSRKASTSRAVLCTQVEAAPTMIDGGLSGPSRKAIVGVDSMATGAPGGAANLCGQPGNSRPVAASMTWSTPFSSPTATIVLPSQFATVGELWAIAPVMHDTQEARGQVMPCPCSTVHPFGARDRDASAVAVTPMAVPLAASSMATRSVAARIRSHRWARNPRGVGGTVERIMTRTLTVTAASGGHRPSPTLLLLRSVRAAGEAGRGDLTCRERRVRTRGSPLSPRATAPVWSEGRRR